VNVVYYYYYYYYYYSWLDSCSGPGLSDCCTLRHTLGRTPLDNWSACRRDLYLTTHNGHNREASMSTAAFEPRIPAIERPQTHALDRACTGTREDDNVSNNNNNNNNIPRAAVLRKCKSLIIHGIHNGAVWKVNKKFISHLTRARRTPSAVATVQVSRALTLSIPN
jgi:hypothetical protein